MRRVIIDKDEDKDVRVQLFCKHTPDSHREQPEAVWQTSASTSKDLEGK